MFSLPFQTTGVTLEVTARFQTNVLLDKYGDHITLFQKIPRIFMPIFWVEQRFIMDTENSSKIKFALDVPSYGRFAGFALLIVGMILIAVPYLKRLFCTSKSSLNLLSKVEAANGNAAVILDCEKNPLMSTTTKLVK